MHEIFCGIYFCSLERVQNYFDDKNIQIYCTVTFFFQRNFYSYEVLTGNALLFTNRNHFQVYSFVVRNISPVKFFNARNILRYLFL